MAETSDQELRHFVSKWYAREPEMQFAEVFVPASDKWLFHVWGALLHELKHTVFELSDAHVTGIKTAWWADELMRLSRGEPRHPVTQSLPDIVLPWQDLSTSLLDIVGSSSARASNTGQAISALMPFSNAVLQIEDRLFDARGQSSGELFAVHCLLQRLPQGLAAEDQAGIPMHLMARYSVSAAQLPAVGHNGLLQDWATELDSVLSDKTAGSLFRSARTRFDRSRLRELMAGRGFRKGSAPKHLWQAWRAAVTQPR